MRDAIHVAAMEGFIDLSSASFPLAHRVGSPQEQALIECYSRQELERFVSARDSLPRHLQGFIVAYTLDEYVGTGARLFLTQDGRGGFALIGGELASLFSLPGARYGDLLVQQAVELGATKLSCFDAVGKLPALYGRHGFKETFRAPWDDSLAPRNWSYDDWGRPDYVEMKR